MWRGGRGGDGGWVGKLGWSGAGWERWGPRAGGEKWRSGGTGLGLLGRVTVGVWRKAAVQDGIRHKLCCIKTWIHTIAHL